MAEHKMGWGIMRYIGMKPWFYGYENWAIPTGAVWHFGEWPEVVKPHARYRTYSSSGGVVGGGLALAAYIYGGEECIRSEFDKAGFNRFFRDIDHAIEVASYYGGEERKAHLRRGAPSLQELVEKRPWAEKSP